MNGELIWRRVSGKRRWQAVRVVPEQQEWFHLDDKEIPASTRTTLVAEVRKRQGSYEVRLFGSSSPLLLSGGAYNVIAGTLDGDAGAVFATLDRLADALSDVAGCAESHRCVLHEGACARP